MDSIFGQKNYRKYIKSFTHSQKKSPGILTRMADSIGCQNSHLSRLLREEVHLTPDQALAVCEFMKLTEPETKYFLKLVDYERAATPKLRERLEKEMQALMTEQENLAKRFQNEQMGSLEKEMTYYSSWFWSAIHILTDIPAYQSSSAIAARLNMDERFVRLCLQRLESFGLVKSEADRWKINTGSIHLPKLSPMNSIQHGNWRTQAVFKSQNPDSQGLHYTIVQSISRNDFQVIKQVLLEAIDRYRQIANQSPAEELICFTCDFFEV